MRIPGRNLGKGGFTLLELLAVLCVVAILAALVFPFIKSFIERANGAKCAANLKSLGAASMAYAADNNGFLPITYSVDSAKGISFVDGGGAWYWLIAPYVDVPRWDSIKTYLGPQGGKIGAPNVFTCPCHGKDEPSPIKYPSNCPVSYAPPNQIYKVVQTRAPTSVTDTANVWGLRLTDVTQQTRKIWLSDSTFNNILNVSEGRWTNPGNDGWARIAFSRHDGAGNAVFYDGHVERISCDSIMTGNLSQNIQNLFNPSVEIK